MSDDPSTPPATGPAQETAAGSSPAPAPVPPDLGAVSAEDLVALVTNASDEQLAEAMGGPNRELALREIFGRMADYLRPEQAKGHDAVVHWHILGRPDGAYDEFELIVRDGKCAVSESPKEEPRVTLTLGPVDFLKLITGPASGPGLFMAGRLKIEGDLMYAPQIASLFRIPSNPNKEGSN